MSEFIPYAQLGEEQKAVVDSDKWIERCAAAMAGLGLDKLAGDEYWYIRRQVAAQGFALDLLVSDESAGVRDAVYEQIGHDENVAIERDRAEKLGAWIAANPEKCALPENREPREDQPRKEKSRVASEEIAKSIEQLREQYPSVRVPYRDAQQLLEAGWDVASIAEGGTLKQVDEKMLEALVSVWVDNSGRGNDQIECCLGTYWAHTEPWPYVVLDNSGGDCYVEEYDTEAGAKAYLAYGLDLYSCAEIDRGELTLEAACEQEYGMLGVVDNAARVMAEKEALWEAGRKSEPVEKGNKGQEQNPPREEKIEERKVGELKPAADKPKQPREEGAVPSKDEAVAKKSAGERGAVDKPYLRPDRLTNHF